MPGLNFDGHSNYDSLMNEMIDIAVLFSNVLVVLHDIYIEAPSGNGAQIDFYVIAPHVTVIIECKV